MTIKKKDRRYGKLRPDYLIDFHRNATTFEKTWRWRGRTIWICKLKNLRLNLITNNLILNKYAGIKMFSKLLFFIGYLNLMKKKPTMATFRYSKHRCFIYFPDRVPRDDWEQKSSLLKIFFWISLINVKTILVSCVYKNFQFSCFVALGGTESIP